MRKVSLYSFICLICLSCKKEEIIVVNPATSATIQLKVDQVINDSTIVLKWSKFDGNKFHKYLLVRNATYFKNGQLGTFTEAVDSSTDVNHLSFTENNMPFAIDIYYYLSVINDSMRTQAAASVYYRRPNSLIQGIAKDVLINKQQQTLYLTEENKITIVNYSSGRQIASKEFPVNIGYCSLGNFNGSLELYVPFSDGWLQILDASTLELKDRIYVAGYEIGSAVTVNGKLYISSSDMTAGTYSNCIKVYDRATKNLIGRTGYWDRTRLVPLEGTSVEMIDLTLSLAPIGLFYYQFTPEGIPVSKKEDNYHGDYMMDPRIVRSFPDGSKFITSSYGTIFNKSLVFDRYLKQYGNYSDFAFNADGSLIYAAIGSQKKIDVITYPATTTINSYPTTFIPYKIFRDGNILVCVSLTYTNQQMTYLVIEKINL